MPLTSNTRREAEALIIAALESDESESRRIAAEAQLNYRLRGSFQRIDEVRELDLNYLTCSEYQLFLDEMRAQHKFFQPDHWSDYQFPKGKALEPVLGVRPTDAEAFCRWLTRRQYGSNERYRLPTTEEAYQYLLPKEMTATWCRDVGEFNLVGLTSDEEHKIKQTLESLLNLKPASLALLDLEPNPTTKLSDFIHTSWGIGTILGVIGFVSWFAIFIGIGLNFPNEYMLLLFMIYLVGVLSIRFSANANEAPTDSRVSNDSIREVLTSDLAKEVFSDLLSREYKLPVMKNNQKFAIQLLSGHLDKRTGERWNKAVAKLRQGVIIRNTVDASQSQNRKEYEWLKVIIARKEGNLPAWESIRVVREYV